MNCDDARELLVNLGFDSDLRKVLMRALEHAHVCADCGDVLQQFDTVREKLRNEFASDNPASNAGAREVEKR